MEKIDINLICKGYNRNFYLSLILLIITISLILISLNNIEKSSCECAKIGEKRFIKEWFIFVLIFQIIILIIFLTSNEPCYIKFIQGNYIYITMMIIGLLNYVMLFRLLLYLRILRNGCECGYNNIEKFLFWYLVIIFSIIGLLIFLSMLMFIITGFKLLK